MESSGSSSSGGGRFKLFEELELQEFNGKFVIKSVESPARGFSISRGDGNIEQLQGKGKKKKEEKGFFAASCFGLRCLCSHFISVL